MKIAFLISSLGLGGAERQLVTLAKGLHERGFETSVMVFYSGGALEKDLRDARVPVHSLEKRHRWDVFGFFLRFIRLLWRERPYILHSYLGIANIIAIMLKPLLPSNRTVWGLRASNVDLSKYDWLTRLIYRLENLLSRFADLIIANSQMGYEYAVSQGFPRDKMVVIPNGIDIERFRPDRAHRERMRALWQVTDAEKLIGLVARFDPIKDHPTFIKAAALLAEERKDVRFVCVGDGPAAYGQELHALADSLGLNDRLIWVGSSEEMVAVYNAFDILTSSSYSEGFSNVIGEAMACGVPCVVTNVGDSARIVGDTGVVIPPQDPQAMAEGWKQLLNAPSQDQLRSASRARIEKEFSTQALIDKTINVLKRELDNS